MPTQIIYFSNLKKEGYENQQSGRVYISLAIWNDYLNKIAIARGANRLKKTPRTRLGMSELAESLTAADIGGFRKEMRVLDQKKLFLFRKHPIRRS